MRLRHKKPINSYAGQGNCDSNVQFHPFQEAHDEDFAKNSLHNKKTRLLKIRPTNQQTRKYAEILCQFVNVVNQGKYWQSLDYRNHCGQSVDPKPRIEALQQKNKAIEPQVAIRGRKDNFVI